MDTVQNCTKCGLHKLLPDGCKPVAGIGPTLSKIMIVGEAPGYDETLLEEPFVGQCGQLLDKLLKAAGIVRSTCYVTNTVKCRPTDDGKKNRPPSKVEIATCKPWLIEEIGLVKPVVILTLGKVPTYTLLKSQLKASFSLGAIAGQIFNVDYSSAKIVPCFHPSTLMQSSKNEIQRTIDFFKMIKVMIS